MILWKDLCRSAACCGLAICTSVLPPPLPTTTTITLPPHPPVALADTGFDIERVSLRRCGSTTNCVSSNAIEPPNRYVSPLKLLKDDDVAFQQAVRDLTTAASTTATSSHKGGNNVDIAVEKIDPIHRYIHLVVPGTAPGSNDDIELLFSQPLLSTSSLGDDLDNTRPATKTATTTTTTSRIVNVRCEARVTLPPPPFCIQRDCINGNLDQRRRVSQIATQILGLPNNDEEQMKEDGAKKWTPIFFNSDRVPGFDDE